MKGQFESSMDMIEVGLKRGYRDKREYKGMYESLAERVLGD